MAKLVAISVLSSVVMCLFVDAFVPAAQGLLH